MNRVWISVLVLAASQIAFGQVAPGQANISGSQDKNVEARLVAVMTGWVTTDKALQDYEVAVDHKARHSGESCGSIKSITSRPMAALLRQAVKADQYLGQRIRLTGFIKTEKVEEWSALWARIDGEQGNRLALDNMKERPITGTTDWRRYDIVLDVPANSVAISFGVVLAGRGQIWADDLQIETVGREIPVTDGYYRNQPLSDGADADRRREDYARRLKEELKQMLLRPTNLGFESPPQ
jgi:hypothetical protein